jgi:hypothetical protein
VRSGQPRRRPSCHPRATSVPQRGGYATSGDPPPWTANANTKRLALRSGSVSERVAAPISSSGCLWCPASPSSAQRPGADRSCGACSRCCPPIHVACLRDCSTGQHPAPSRSEQETPPAWRTRAENRDLHPITR